MFKGKKILFFAANFFGYQLEIKEKLESLGAEVHYYDERPKNTFWYKVLIRINKKLIKRRINDYYSKILKSTENEDYDFIFFLKAEVILPKMLEKYRIEHKNAKMILYMWDSIENCKSVVYLFPFFDKILSFDPIDSKENKNIKFRPLFYLDDYASIDSNFKNNCYDISFVGTGHVDRYPLIKKIKSLCVDHGLKHYFFIYLQDSKIFLLRKLFFKDFKDSKRHDFSFTPLNKYQIIEIIKSSKVVLDIERSVQCGLTMRTIEVLGAKRKLITTNMDIKNYDFYDEKNILIINRNDPKIDIKFFKENYNEINSRIYKKYSLTSWLNEVFFDS